MPNPASVDVPTEPVRPELQPTLFGPAPTGSRYAPGELVAVPRALVPHYASLPWSEVVAAARRGVDGLVYRTSLPRRYLGHEGEVNENPDTAFLREGDGHWKQRTLLYQQNW